MLVISDLLRQHVDRVIKFKMVYVVAGGHYAADGALPESQHAFNHVTLLLVENCIFFVSAVCNHV
ncbi:hypothetical protein SRABI106_03050 [Rahnella aquatilis]|nr:hypothetical protein SRABI106_03050 [Rahnella aquatilis]